MEWKFANNKELVTIQLTKEEAEVVNNYLLDRRIKLEACGLEDSYCYPKLSSSYYKLLNAISKETE